MRGDVQIVSAAEFARRSVVVPARFQLRFPPTWRASPVQNRYADAIERQTLCWLASHGIGTSADERDKLEKFQCGMYGGYSLPLADYHTGLLVTEFISLWLFWDDAQVEEDFGWTVDSVVAALTGPTASPPSRYVAAWADLGARLRATQSERWLVRLGATMRQWLDNARAETAMAKAYRDRGACPEVAALFDCRTISIGMFPTFHLIEYAEGFELPDELHAHAAVVELKRLASRLVGLGNDLGGARQGHPEPVAQPGARRSGALVAVDHRRLRAHCGDPQPRRPRIRSARPATGRPAARARPRYRRPASRLGPGGAPQRVRLRALGIDRRALPGIQGDRGPACADRSGDGAAVAVRAACARRCRL